MNRKLQNKTTVKKGARRVEAWIYAVINPLIEALRIERSFLEEKNWTWRYQTNDLEFIFPLEKYVDFASLPNLEDFLKAHPQMDRRRKKHDDLRTALSENCVTAFNHLVALQSFQERIKVSLSTYEKENPASEYPGGAFFQKDFDKLIAQYIVNCIKELPDHYTTSKFWSKFGSQFLQFRTIEVFKKVDSSGMHLESEDGRLLTMLDNLRSNLCEEYDIPAAPVYYHDLVEQGI